MQAEMEPSESEALAVDHEQLGVAGGDEVSETDMRCVAPKFALGKPLHYLREQWPYLIRYLRDGQLEPSDNPKGA